MMMIIIIINERAIYICILEHILNNNIVDCFLSVYREGHSCETVLLRVYDIVTTVGKQMHGQFFVLLVYPLPSVVYQPIGGSRIV